MVTFNVPDTLAFNINGTTNTLNLSATSNTTNWTLTLPENAGTANYVLQTDGNGVTSWAQVSSVPSVNQNQFLVGDSTNQAVDQGSVLTFSTAIVNGPVFTIGDTSSTTVTMNIGSTTASTANVVINLSGSSGSSTIDHQGSGSFTISSTSGTVTVGSNLTVNGNVTTDSDFVFDNTVTTNNLNLSASTNTTNWTLTLPDNAGTANFVLQTDGTGVTSWVEVSSVPTVNQNQFLVGDSSNQAVDQGTVLTFSTAIVNGPVFSVGDTTTTTATFNLGSTAATTANAVINLSGSSGSSTIDHKGTGSFTISASNSGQITLVQSGIQYRWPTDTPAANEVLAVSSFNSPTAVLNWASVGLSSVEYRQVKVSSDTTAPANNSAVVFSTTALVNSGSITNNGSGVFSLSSGNTYRLVARLGIINVSGILSYQWYDNTNAQFVGVPGEAISTNNPTNQNTVNDAVAVVSTSSSMELRILSGGTGTTIDATYSSAYVEKIGDTTGIADFTGATTAVNGTSGLVPAPTTSEINNYFLKSDGTWSLVNTSSEYRQVKVSSDTTAPANNAAVVFSTTAIANSGSITNNGSGVFSLSSGKTYRLVARLGITNISSVLSYQWYDNTNAQFVGVPGEAISTDNVSNQNTINDAVAVVSTSSSVELRILSGGTTTTIDATYSSAYVEKIGDNTGITQFSGSTTANAGTIGYVPAPTTAEINYILASNGSWVDYISKSSEDIVVNNSSTAGSIIMRPGTATTATSVRIQDSANQDQMYVEMDGGVFCPQLRNASGNVLAIDGTTGELLETVSLRAYKIQETLIEEEPGYDVEDVLKLEPKFFSWKDNGQRDLGFIVEDAVEFGLDQFLYHDNSGPKNFSDRSIIAGLVALVKKMHSEIQELKNR